MRFTRERKWENWFAWYPVYLRDTGESVWLEWTHRYPDYWNNVLLGYFYQAGKKP